MPSTFLSRLSHEFHKMTYLLKQDQLIRWNSTSADKIFVVKVGIYIKTHFHNRRVARPFDVNPWIWVHRYKRYLLAFGVCLYVNVCREQFERTFSAGLLWAAWIGVCEGLERSGTFGLLGMLSRLAPPLGLACNYNRQVRVTAGRRDDIEWSSKIGKSNWFVRY